ncbi:hypothetical protein EAS68_07425 [Legionella jordanis]|uniref:AbiJ-NTD4 domain-containing protein n=1 Tax=Legionella jordanis TaxID=456 RepID=UPI000EFF0ED0|nr:hypothetical protein [Legionella jordanis]RMX19252.1 hypothetical protein EAS68_07425 [Legionella jordanis]
MSFSERQGYKNREPSQLEGIGSDLKNSIFNIIHSSINNYISIGITGYGDSTYRGKNAQLIWTDFFNKRTSELPYAGNFVEEFESLYNSLNWFEVYDLMEFLISLPQVRHNALVANFNRVLETSNSPYRIINQIVQPISNKETIHMIDNAHKNAPTAQSKNHLVQAEKLYSRKQDPDFNNSCLESIKAIESCLHSVFNNQKILGDNIKELKGSNHNQHILAILEKVNAFRNDVSAHATKSKGYIPNRKDAILIHSICCSFINYLTTTQA